MSRTTGDAMAVGLTEADLELQSSNQDASSTKS